MYITLALTNKSFAHKEWVHQYIVKQAYLFLANQLGFDVNEIKNYIGFDFYGKGSDDDPWGTGLIGVASWREDLEDPVFGVGTPFDGWDPSSTHFWDADNGDDVKTPIFGSPPIANAYYKARIYLFGGHRIFFQKKVFDSDVGFILGRFYSYNSLAEFYKTGKCYYHGYKKIEHPPVIFETPIELYMDIQNARKYARQILGRVAHLLADMSVPAHVKNDKHPCELNNIDGYELYMGGNSGNVLYCNEPKVYFPAQNWTWQTALNQGGLIDVSNMNANEVIRYLFYTQNQLSDFFPSEDFEGDDYLPNGTNSYIILRYSSLGLPPSNVNYQAIADETFNFCIRATATLFYWFALETDMLPNTFVINSFGGGKVLANNIEYSSGARIPAWYLRPWQPPTPVTLQAINQSYNGCNWQFRSWHKIVNGNIIQTYYTPTITITPEANTTYRANFEQGQAIFYSNMKYSESVYWNESKTFTITTNAPSANYYWLTKIRGRGANGPVWDEGFPPVASAAFYEDGNSATIYNLRYIPPPSYFDSVVLVRGSVYACNTWRHFDTYVCLHSYQRPEPPPPPPTPGCPFVYTWNGSYWEEDNNILPQSEFPENYGVDVTDYYQLFHKPILEDDKYKIAIKEFEEERSYFNRFQLLVVDHNPNASITISDDGTIIQFAKPQYLLNAQLDSTSVIKKVSELDGVKVEVSESETLSLWFTQDGGNYVQGLLLIGQIRNPEMKRYSAGQIQTKGKDKFVSFSSFRLRRNPTYTWLLVPSSDTSTMQIDINWAQDAALDYTELSRMLELPFTVHTATLTNAVHSNYGDVTSVLLDEDENRIDLINGESIELEFSAPPIQEEMERSFILISCGRYERIENTKQDKFKSKELSSITNPKVPSEKTNINLTSPQEFKLYQNSPNPFNPITKIKYSIKEQGLVTLKIFDLLGREISTLVNELKQAGEYEVEFNAEKYGLSSGVYLYQLKSGSYTATKKFVYLR